MPALYLRPNSEKYEDINYRERNNFNWQNRVVSFRTVVYLAPIKGRLLNHVELKALYSTHGLYIEPFRFNIEFYGKRLADNIYCTEYTRTRMYTDLNPFRSMTRACRRRTRIITNGYLASDSFLACILKLRCIIRSSKKITKYSVSRY